MANRGNFSGGYSGGDMDETRVYRNGIPGVQAGQSPQGGQRRQSSYSGYSEEDYYAGGQQGYYDGSQPDQNGYYYNGGQDEGYYDGQDYYDDQGYYDESQDYYDGGQGYYDSQPQQGMSMAARAAGKQNPDPYGRSRSGEPQRQRAQQQARRMAGQSYDYEARPRQPQRRRRKRHGLRNFLIFLLLLAGLLATLYFLLFRAPAVYEDGVHTRKSGFYNILICATDEEQTRTDTMMLLSLDEKNSTVSLTSLPRDTIVDNGASVPKLNGVYGIAGGGTEGAEAVKSQLKSLLGFEPDAYVIINYQVFKDVVNALGGVTFDVPMDMTMDDPDTGDPIYLSAGEQVLNGTQALGLCRFRYGYLMADIQRQYVQQSFLKALIQQAASPSNWTKLPAVYRAVMENTVTDLEDANIRYLALHALLAGINDIPQNTLPGEGVDYYGASCYGLYGQSVVDMVNEVMNPFAQDITIEDVHILTVSEGELVESTSRGVAFDASTYDYSSYSE